MQLPYDGSFTVDARQEETFREKSGKHVFFITEVGSFREHRNGNTENDEAEDHRAVSKNGFPVDLEAPVIPVQKVQYALLASRSKDIMHTRPGERFFPS